MAEFSKGDRIVKMSGIAAGKYGTVNSVREDGTLNVTFDGERLSRFCDPERCGKVAANAAGDSKRVNYLLELRDKRREEADKVWHDLYVKYDGHIPVSEVKKFNASPIGKGREFSAKERAEFDRLIARLIASRNARAANAASFDNPNYDPAAGMKYLDTHFQMFDPKVAKAMIEDARRKGVKVPPGVLEKARRAGIVENSRVQKAANAKFKVGDKVAYSVFGQTRIGTVVEVSEKFHSEYGNEHEGEQTYMVDFGKKPYSKTWESRMTLANACARNAVARRVFASYDA